MRSETILERWSAELHDRGFDLVVAFDTGLLRGLETLEALPSFGQPSSFALFVAHGRALWKPFLNALARDPALASSEHPLDRYTEACIEELCRTESVAARAFYSHSLDPCLPFQRMAELIGLAELSPSRLSIHPRLGPWLGLRALIVFDAPPVRQRSVPRRLSLCAPCAKPCMAALSKAQAEPRDHGESWFRAWLRVRDSCPVGRDARYGDNQIHYHYTKDKRALSE